MTHRRLLGCVFLGAALAAALGLWGLPRMWWAFAAQVALAAGTAATLLPAGVVAARMLDALPRSGERRFPVLDTLLREVAQQPRRWHFLMLMAGLGLILAGAALAAAAAWPT